jgi:hypothetical protein
VGSDDGVEHSELLGFPTLPIARYPEEHLKYATFRKLDMFPSSFEAVETPLLCQLARVNISHWTYNLTTIEERRLPFGGGGISKTPIFGTGIF